MTAPTVAKAKIVLKRGDSVLDTVPVQFNPASLQVEISNSTSPQSGSGSTAQTATQTSAKLGLDLLFDTTHSGDDVRSITRRLRAAVRDPDAGGDAPAAGAAPYTPPSLRFEWGTFCFTGIADGYRETLDFFSAEGVPLRAQVAMSLKEQPGEFSATEADNPAAAAASRARSGAVELPGGGADGAGAGLGGASGLAAAGGDLRAARAIASANGEASLRFSAGATLAVTSGVQLQAAVGFAGGSAAPAAPALRFDVARLVSAAPSRALPTDAGASFGIDGRASAGTGAGLRADVGLRFED
jgi:hypothetical protein